jgi:hypothetical protein
MGDLCKGGARLVNIYTLKTTAQQEQGVLPFMTTNGGLPYGVFFFPYAHSQTLSGVGLGQLIRAYALDLNFKPILTAFGKMIILKPGEVIQLPLQTVHVVETSIALPPITDFSFLRKEV